MKNAEDVKSGKQKRSQIKKLKISKAFIVGKGAVHNFIVFKF